MSDIVLPENLEITSGRPLVISDADEVLLRFLAGLERFLPSQDLYLDLKSYALTGAIRRAGSGDAVDQAGVSQVIKTFHATAGLDLDPVAGAADALSRISAEAQVVVLTNIIPENVAGRRANLLAHGIDFPVLNNSGLKGPMVAALAKRAAAPAFFVDDIPHHHASVATLAPGTHQIHFVADERLFRMATRSPHAALFTSDWSETADHILATLGGVAR